MLNLNERIEEMENEDKVVTGVIANGQFVPIEMVEDDEIVESVTVIVYVDLEQYENNGYTDLGLETYKESIR